MDSAIIVAAIMSVGSFAGSLFLFLSSFRKGKAEGNKINADAATLYQSLASKQAEDNAKLEARIDELERLLRLKDGEIATLKARVLDLETENAALRAKVDELEQRRRK